MTREMEYAKCMAVLRKIVRMGMITENEYVAARNKLMEQVPCNKRFGKSGGVTFS